MELQAYQTSHLFGGFIGVPGWQENAPAKPGWFTIGPMTRNLEGECGSV